MASASIPLYNLGSGYTIVTQVLPSTVDQNSSQAVGPLQKFLKGEPKALGTVQIMNGIMILLLGIWLLSDTSNTVYFFVIFCGSFFHIMAGSLTVSACNKLHPTVVKWAMAVNILSAISAAIIVIILILYLRFNRFTTAGISSIFLLVFSLLQFAVSIAISAFACKATASNEPTILRDMFLWTTTFQLIMLTRGSVQLMLLPCL
ncbi:membrane-spanning 4-domains subfamily A member 4D isoform X3 [Ictalurus punctatus]|uniref:Membrane-spanning 4-domains subfamily A member 4D isoform X3 n=1 Tax=Ictalurus punctatus TaxID=7998 RepID=A0A979F529_ICTPU|nr:membrane-spanning 4-domains subfamily A member 4D isoform X3 [Ictalurus punctatus]